MGFLLPFYFFILVIFRDLGLSNGVTSQVSKTITVDQSGHGNFQTIQSAIDSVPPNNDQWIRILVGPGVFKEKVQIPKKKRFIILEGAGLTKTTISWDDHSSTSQSATFTSSADNFVARSISFKNTYNHKIVGDGVEILQAVAAEIKGDKSSFYNCGFYGLQDTVCDLSGRHYFKSCYIEGYIDFIFGMGQSIYERCVISVNEGPLKSTTGAITAQGRENANDTNGFVFKYCAVLGNGEVLLGRAWRNHSRVIFHQTSMSSVVAPEGWDAWMAKGNESQLTYVESGCIGSGSKNPKRVKWEKNLSLKELYKLLSMSFIDTEGWIKQQPS